MMRRKSSLPLQNSLSSNSTFQSFCTSKSSSSFLSSLSPSINSQQCARMAQTSTACKLVNLSFILYNSFQFSLSRSQIFSFSSFISQFSYSLSRLQSQRLILSYFCRFQISAFLIQMSWRRPQSSALNFWSWCPMFFLRWPIQSLKICWNLFLIMSISLFFSCIICMKSSLFFWTTFSSRPIQLSFSFFTLQCFQQTVVSVFDFSWTCLPILASWNLYSSSAQLKVLLILASYFYILQFARFCSSATTSFMRSSASKAFSFHAQISFSMLSFSQLDSSFLLPLSLSIRSSSQFLALSSKSSLSLRMPSSSLLAFCLKSISYLISQSSALLSLILALFNSSLMVNTSSSKRSAFLLQKSLSYRVGESSWRGWDGEGGSLGEEAQIQNSAIVIELTDQLTNKTEYYSHLRQGHHWQKGGESGCVGGQEQGWKLYKQNIRLAMSKLQSPEKEGQNSTHATGHLGMVENLTREADRDLQEYHKLIELFRQELNSMRTKIDNINQQITETTTPLVESLYRNLEMGMISQKEENANFQEQVTDLKKEKSVLSQMISASFKRTEELNNQVGHY